MPSPTSASTSTASSSSCSRAHSFLRGRGRISSSGAQFGITVTLSAVSGQAVSVGGTRDHAWQVGRSTLVHGQPERTSVVQFLVLWTRQRNGQLRITLD